MVQRADGRPTTRDYRKRISAETPTWVGYWPLRLVTNNISQISHRKRLSGTLAAGPGPKPGRLVANSPNAVCRVSASTKPFVGGASRSVIPGATGRLLGGFRALRQRASAANKAWSNCSPRSSTGQLATLLGQWSVRGRGPSSPELGSRNLGHRHKAAGPGVRGTLRGVRILVLEARLPRSVREKGGSSTTSGARRKPVRVDSYPSKEALTLGSYESVEEVD